MKVFLTKWRDPSQIRSQLQAALQWIGWEERIRSGTRVFLKPNLTWRLPTPGVTTTPAFIEAVVSVLAERTCHLIVGEADGGYHSFSAEEAFQSHGLKDLSNRYGIKLVNLSKEPAEVRSAAVADKLVTVELPRVLLNDIDVFVTLPVPKVHAMTGVSLGFKNQWGCQPGTMRLRNHPDFSRRIVAINRLLNPSLALYDGTYFLDENGPMSGKPVRMDLLLASDDVGAGDFACCEIMGIDPSRIRHLRLAAEEGMMPTSLDQMMMNQMLEPFKRHHFRLKRSLLQYVTLIAFHSRFGTRLLYDSLAAGPLHRILYTIRKNRLIGRLLYGPVGPPPIEGYRV